MRQETRDFLTELNALCKKHNAKIYYTSSPCSDWHGINDFYLTATVNGEEVDIDTELTEPLQCHNNEINITPIVALMTSELEVQDIRRCCDPWYVSSSIANIGPDVGEIGWSNAQHVASFFRLCSDGYELVRSHFLEYGAWTEEKLPIEVCLPMLVQQIASTLNMIAEQSDGEEPTHKDRSKTDTYCEVIDYIKGLASNPDRDSMDCFTNSLSIDRHSYIQARLGF